MGTQLTHCVRNNRRRALMLVVAICTGCAANKPCGIIRTSGSPVLPDTVLQLVEWQIGTQESDEGQNDKVAAAESSSFNEQESVHQKQHEPPLLNLQLPANSFAEMSVEECVQTALAAHPKILAARSRVLAAQNQIPQARALPDPMLDNMFWPIQSNTLQTAGGRMQDQIGLSQQVPWPDKLRAKAAIAIREMQVAQAEVESMQREIAESVRLAYYEIWFAERGTKIVLENQGLVSDLIRVSEARYRAGGSQQDVVNAEIERERLQQQLLELASQKAAAQAELAALLRQPQTLVIDTQELLPLDDVPAQLDALVATAEQCNPELRGLAFQIQRDLEKQRLACLQCYPDFQMGLQYGFMSRGGAISPVADGLDMISFSVGATLPVWRDKIRGGINEAAAERASTIQLREAEQLSIEGRLRRLLSEIHALDQQRELYARRILPRAEQVLEIAISEYTVGKTTFIQLTDNYRELLMFQLQVARIESSLAGRLAQLKRTVGCP